MKIGLVVHDFHSYGGHSRYIYELSRCFAQNNEVHIFTSSIQQKVDAKVYYHIIPALKEPIIAKIFSFWLSGSVTKPHRYVDVLNSIGGCVWGGDVTTVQFCGRSWSKAAKRYDLGKGNLRSFYRANSWRLSDILEQQPLRKLPSKQIIAISNRVARDLRDDYNVKGPVTVIPTAVDGKIFNPNIRRIRRNSARIKFEISDDTFVLLFVGEFQRKGLSVVLKALDLLKSRGKANKMRLICFGDRHPQPFEEMTKNLDLRSSVQFLPPSTHIEDFYSLADLFVFPTLYEPFGMVITEALASGLPTITSKWAGAADFYNEQSQWLLLDEPGDPQVLADKIEQVYNDYNNVQKLTSELSEQILDWTWEKLAQRTLEVYRQI